MTDNYQLIPQPTMRYQADKWARQTRAKIIAAGDWPKNLPLLENT